MSELTKPDLNMLNPVWVDTPEALLEACAVLSEAPALAVDTEFVRERTFFPGLGLIQIAADAETQYLIDPVTLEDLSPLGEILADGNIVKVLHSCGEDLEVLYHRFGAFPEPLFDTQIAGAFTGLGASIGYGPMVAKLFSVDLPKGETRSNWLQRPLTDAQIRYAALDVVHLLPAAEHLLARLEDLGRRRWVADDVAGLADVARFLPDSRELYRRVKSAHTYSRRQLGVLRELYAWRELTARKKDRPRNFIVREQALPEIGRIMPQRLEEFDRIRELSKKENDRWSEEMLAAVHRGLELPQDELPEEIKRSLDLTPHKKLVKRLRAKLIDTAEDLGVPPETLATRKTLERLARNFVRGEEPILPDTLQGWRCDVIGEPLLEAAER